MWNKKLFFSISLVFMGVYLNAQSNSQLLDLAREASKNNDDSTKVYLDLIRASNEDILLFQTDIIEGQFLKNRRNYDEAIAKFKSAEQINERIKNPKNTAILKDLISDVLGIQGKYDEAFDLKASALETFKELADSASITKCLMGIARLFNNRRDYEEGFKYTEDAISYANNNADLAFALANKGIYYKNQNEFDSARFYYQKGIEMYDEDPAFLMRSYYNLALLEKRLKNIPKALAYYDKAIDITRRMKDSITEAVLEVNRTFIYYDQKRFSEAERILNNHEALLLRSGTIQNKLDFWLIRYNISEKLGQASDALSHYRAYREIRDSLDNLALNTKIAEFETKYETAEKERQIAIQDQKILLAENQKKILLGGLATVVWLGAFGILYFWSRNRFNKQIAEKKIENLEQEKRIMAISSMLEGQEAERSRIAQDLHDSIGGLLTTVKVHFGVIQREIEKIAQLDIGKKVEGLIDEASLEVRRISHKMSPRTLQINGLQAAFKDAVMDLEASSDLKVEYEWNGKEGMLNETSEIVLYRILQELISNVSKHANASELLVQVNVFEDTFNLIVEDNGKGFDFVGSEQFSGLGLAGIRSRVEFLKGSMELDSKVGLGTSIHILVPIEP